MKAGTWLHLHQHQQRKEETVRHTMKGEWSSRRVWLDAKELLPGPSQKIWNHSPDGFNWGYGGSGPAQLALAVCFKLTKDRDKAVSLHQQFKRDIIAVLPQSDFEILFAWDSRCSIARYVNALGEALGGAPSIASAETEPKALPSGTPAAYPAAQPRSDQVQPQRSAECGPCELDCYCCPDL